MKNDKYIVGVRALLFLLILLSSCTFLYHDPPLRKAGTVRLEEDHIVFEGYYKKLAKGLNLNKEYLLLTRISVFTSSHTTLGDWQLVWETNRNAEHYDNPTCDFPKKIIFGETPPCFSDSKLPQPIELANLYRVIISVTQVSVETSQEMNLSVDIYFRLQRSKKGLLKILAYENDTVISGQEVAGGTR